MAKQKKQSIKVYIDPLGNTLNIWWDDPSKSVISEEAEKSWDVICLDKQGRAIGFEKIGLFPHELDPTKYLQEAAGDQLEGKVLMIKNGQESVSR
jgi:hypothetical protein